MKVSKILVPAVALMATNNYINNNQVAAVNCLEVCNAGLAACSTKCATFGWFLPGGMPLCEAGCAAA
jgi:hypothetical protein